MAGVEPSVAWPTIWPATPQSLISYLHGGQPGDCRGGNDRAHCVYGLDLVGTIQLWRDRGEPRDEVLKAARACGDVIEGSLKFPGYQLHAILEQSLDKTASGVEYAPIDSEPGADTLRFPSGIPSIQNTAGGYYGISIILGSTGVGKSMAAIASACDAALAGWRVIYFNAEIARRAFYRRVARRIGHTDEARHELQSRFKHYLAGPGITLEEMRLSILDQIRHTDDKLLIILDSVNTIAELMADEGAWSYFDALKRIGFWALESRRESEGKISWILTSETNKQQEVKGQKLAYLADYILRLEKGDTDDHVRIFCEKGREGGGGTLGPHLREWRTGEFLGEGDRPGDRGGEEEPVF